MTPKIIDVGVLEPIEITGWRRQRAEDLKEARRKTRQAARAAKKKADAAEDAVAKKAKQAKRKAKRAMQPEAKKRRPAPWPESASTVGVYGLLHRSTNSIYIGYTADKNGFKWRWKRHKAQLFVAKTHHCTILQDFVNDKGLRPRDFQLVIFSSYPSRPRTQTLADKLVKEEVEIWDRAQAAGFTMLCERPLGVKRKYVRVNKND